MVRKMRHRSQHMIVLMRHAQTRWNEAGLVMGQTDLPLSEGGMQQAEAVASELGDLKVGTLFSSTLIRCQQTAEFVSRALDLPITVLPGLEERCWGIYEGRHHTERVTIADPPEGEALSHFQDRIAVVLDLIATSVRPWLSRILELSATSWKRRKAMSHATESRIRSPFGSYTGRCSELHLSGTWIANIANFRSN